MQNSLVNLDQHIHQISVKIFFIENLGYPDKDISKNEIDLYRIRSSKFINSVKDLLKMTSDTELEISTEFYDIGKKNYGTSKEELKLFFRDIYIVMFHSLTGPRMPTFIAMCGMDYFKEILLRKTIEKFV